jgi:hypothetical protein
MDLISTTDAIFRSCLPSCLLSFYSLPYAVGAVKLDHETEIQCGGLQINKELMGVQIFQKREDKVKGLREAEQIVQS